MQRIFFKILKILKCFKPKYKITKTKNFVDPHSSDTQNSDLKPNSGQGVVREDFGKNKVV